MEYWQAVIEFERETARGTTKKIKETYLVDAQSGTEAEAKVYEELEKDGFGQEFQVIGLTKSRIIKVLENEG